MISSTIPVGYTCSVCKQWIAFGASHQCTPPPNPPMLFDPANLRIAEALERIARALEAK